MKTAFSRRLLRVVLSALLTGFALAGSGTWHTPLSAMPSTSRPLSPTHRRRLAQADPAAAPTADALTSAAPAADALSTTPTTTTPTTPTAAASTSVTVAISAVSGPAPTPASTPTPALSSLQQLQQVIIQTVNDPTVNITVLPQQRKGKHIVIVSGKVSAEGQQRVHIIMAKFAPELIAEPIYHFDPADKPTDKPAEKPPVTPAPALITEVWPLTFVDDSVSGVAAAEQYSVQPMVDALNAVYGTDSNKKPIQIARNALVLRGDSKMLLDIKHQLVQLDAAGPQVQLDVWAIEISGKRGPDLDHELQHISRLVRETQDALQAVLGLIQIKNDDLDNDSDTVEALKYLKELGFDTNPERHLSLNEKIIFVGLASKQGRKNIFLRLKTAFRSPSPLAQLWANNQQYLEKGEQAPEFFPRTQAVISAETVEVKRDHLAIVQFAKSAYFFTHPPTDTTGLSQWPSLKSDLPLGLTFDKASKDDLRQAALKAAAPIQLRLRATTADALFKVVMDAFTADIQEMFLNPMLKHLLNEQQGKSIKGISLVGRTRLVVTSGLQTTLAPDLVSYVETTRPAPLTKEILDLAFPRTVGGGTATSDTTTATTNQKTPDNNNTTGTSTVTDTASNLANNLTGLSGVLANLPAGEAIALAAALNPPTPTFSKIAPGIGINVRPSVLPDGGAARLQIDMHFGVEATSFEGNAAAKNVLTYPPADSIKSNQVSTDAIVSAFDLFDISSFDISTSYPRPPGYVPVLGTLPLIGPVFQWRRKDTQLEHHSLILVNTVILPRAMSLTQFYTSGSG